ncbi:MAG: tRNA epoxyqueuosine(34) reductase QueG [Bacteroidia bacterium]|nr:tRNA epoxyqueuosine(34) reductase QueG [Bacteroidia bacterium]
MLPHATAARIKAHVHEEALRLGFAYCGFARATPLEAEKHALERWLAVQYHGQMAYMADHFEARTDPQRLLPGSQTVLVVLAGYLPPEGAQQPPGAPKIARYAWGKDYHHVLREQLQALIRVIRECCGPVLAQWYVDAAPVMEKAWARRAGLGWVGKNTCLIRPEAGSYFLLGEIFTEVDFPPDDPLPDYCGTCTRCIDACPTGALTPYQIDARRCISYLTIELKDQVPQEFEGQLEGWAFGCDICQEVCPWNRFARTGHNAFFRPLPHSQLSAHTWLTHTNTQYTRFTRPTPLRRIRRPKWLGNLAAAGYNVPE